MRTHDLQSDLQIKSVVSVLQPAQIDVAGRISSGYFCLFFFFFFWSNSLRAGEVGTLSARLSGRVRATRHTAGEDFSEETFLEGELRLL